LYNRIQIKILLQATLFLLSWVSQSELQIWSLKYLSFQWNSSSYLQASYFGLCKQKVLTILSRLVMLKKSQHAVTSWNSLQIRNR